MADRSGRGSDMEGPYQSNETDTSGSASTDSYKHLMGKSQPAHLGSQSQAPGKEDYDLLGAP